MKEKKNNFEDFRKKTLQVLKDRLSDKLQFHSVDHILDVERAAVKIARESGIEEDQIKLLRTAALIHDIGFIYTYAGHEDESCEFAEEKLPEYDYSDTEIKLICGMIQATKIPQDPKTKLDKILADADLDYLGRDDYEPIANRLYQEMKTFGFINDEKEWLQIQIDFLRKHHYHTDWAIENRAPQKRKVLERLEDQQK